MSKTKKLHQVRVVQWMVDIADKYKIDIETVRGIAWQFSYLTATNQRRERTERFFSNYFDGRDRATELYGFERR